MELINIKKAPKEFKVELLKGLGYGIDGNGVYVTKDGEPVKDPYLDKPVRFENMAIFPGSTIILDDNPLSIALYLEDHPEVS